jgi:hypothetical protein
MADRAEKKARQSIELQNAETREAFERMRSQEIQRASNQGTVPTKIVPSEGSLQEFESNKTWGYRAEPLCTKIAEPRNSSEIAIQS